MDGLNLNQIFSIIRADQHIPPNLSDYYSETFCDIIRTNWSNIKCDLTIGNHLFTNQFTFRISKLQPQQGKDYWPSKLGHHNALIKYAKGIIQEYYVQRFDPLYINFSPNMIVSENGESFFLYSSRSNFACLQTAYFIHDLDSFNHFFDVILPQFDLESYIDDAVEILQRKYSGLCLPASLTWHLSRSQGHIFGSGLASSCCKGQQKNNCIWKGLSAKFDFFKGKVTKTIHKRKQPENRRALRLKSAFVKWFEKTHPSKKVPASSKGYDASSINYLECFLNENINVYRCKKMPAKRIHKLEIKDVIRKNSKSAIMNKNFICDQPSRNNFNQTTNLLATDEHIRCIIDTKQLSGKFICNICCWSFSRSVYLENHECKNKPSFKCESLVTPKQTLKQLIDYTLQGMTFIMDSNFCFVTMKRADSSIMMTVSIKMSNQEKAAVNVEFENTKQCADYLIDYLHTSVKQLLIPRLKDNVQFVSNLENILNDEMLKSASAKFYMDEACVRYRSLLEIKNHVMDYLNFVPCFILASASQIEIAEQLMHDLLGSICDPKDKGEISVKYIKGKLASIKKKSHHIHYRILHLLSSQFVKPTINMDNEIQEFNKMVSFLKKDFGVDFLNTCFTLTDVGKLILNSHLNEATKLSFYSPSHKLYMDLQNSVKFGLLGCRSTVIHQNSHFKSGLSIDLQKFYLSLLQRLKPYVGLGLIYQKAHGSDLFVSNPTRSRATFANLLFSMFNDSLMGNVYHCLYGREIRCGSFGYPCDGILHTKSGRKSIISYDSCFYHPHWTSDGTECHKFIGDIPVQHLLLCDTCKSYNQKSDKDYLKPTLFRLKQTEKSTSKHPVKKGMTFDQVNEHSLKNQATVSESRCYDSHIVIQECKIIHYFYKNMEEFCQFYDLPLKPEFQKQRFCDVLEHTAQTHFPLLKVKTLTAEKVIKNISSGKLTGFVNLSCNIGVEGQKNLGVIKPFNYRDSDGKPVGSYQICKQTVDTSLLEMLIRCPFIPDFKITSIHYFIEYRRTPDCIYESMAEQVFQSLEKRSQNKAYCQILKQSLNSGIGQLAYKAKNYNKTILFGCDDFLSVSQLQHFVTSTKVTENLSLMHFRQNSVEKNLSQIHSQLLSYGKAVMMTMLLKLQSFSSLVVFSINTDGAECASPVTLQKEALMEKSPSKALDYFLKHNVSLDQLDDFLNFKQTYFKKPGFCLEHKLAYKTCLQKGKLFEPSQCCKSYISKTCDFSLRIDIISDVGVIQKTNRSCLLNTLTGLKVTKCSGSYEKDFDTLSNMTYSQLVILANK